MWKIFLCKSFSIYIICRVVEEMKRMNLFSYREGKATCSRYHYTRRELQKRYFARIFAMNLQFYYQGTRGSRSRRILPIILWWWVCSRPGFNNYIIGNYHHYYVRLVPYNWINESNITYLQVRSIFRPKGFSQSAVGNF